MSEMSEKDKRRFLIIILAEEEADRIIANFDAYRNDVHTIYRPDEISYTEEEFFQQEVRRIIREKTGYIVLGTGDEASILRGKRETKEEAGGKNER